MYIIPIIVPFANNRLEAGIRYIIDIMRKTIVNLKGINHSWL